MELKDRFAQAVADSKNLSEKPANDILLQLYGLYKQATVGDINIELTSDPFDFVSKAKYDAWSCHKGKSKEQAMREYITLINTLKG